MATVLASLDHLAELRAALAAAPRVALDTEFHAERRYLPQLLLVQIHVPAEPEGTTWVVDPLVPGLLEGIGPALAAVPWVVHGGQQDLRLLASAIGAVPERVLDTQLAAGLLRSDYPAGYATLVGDVLGVPVDKGATLSDWSRRPLSKDQLRYASRDVELLLPLWARLEEAVRARGREEACVAACDEARAAALQPPPDDALYRDLNGLGHLDPEQAVIAQELVAWREDLARASDQPPRSVLSDGLVLDLARRRPSTVDRMLDNRRFPRALAKRYGPDLIELVHRAQRRPAWGHPTYVRAGTSAATTLDFLRVWAEVHARSAQLSARLVLPRDRLEDVALAIAARGASAVDVDAILGAWRAPLVGDPLRDVILGRTALRLHDAGDVRAS